MMKFLLIKIREKKPVKYTEINGRDYWEDVIMDTFRFMGSYDELPEALEAKEKSENEYKEDKFCIIQGIL